MNSTRISDEAAADIQKSAPVEWKLEVVVLPVRDVERAKSFYASLGWRLDADFTNGDWRVVQLTPPGSPSSILFGQGITAADPGSVHGNFLTVDDVTAARAELVGRGIEVSDVFHFENSLIRATGEKGRVPGPDPEGRTYRSFISFSDPDGNSWLVQEITTRLPGRGGLGSDVASLTELLREAEELHGDFDKPTAPKHHWSDWYAAYLVAREHGRTREESIREGALHVANLQNRSKGI